MTRDGTAARHRCVVLHGATKLMDLQAHQEAGLRPIVERRAIGTGWDDRWQQMLRSEITGRGYWAELAEELGAAVSRAC
ncbi:MAG TPA: hypothetical protein VHS54_12630 [Jatrophihabitans sp.]|jgi:hypothetical protein|nr:hypothetical protein [Jatrophihabitans sp.]